MNLSNIKLNQIPKAKEITIQENCAPIVQDPFNFYNSWLAMEQIGGEVAFRTGEIMSNGLSLSSEHCRSLQLRAFAHQLIYLVCHILGAM